MTRERGREREEDRAVWRKFFAKGPIEAMTFERDSASFEPV